MPQNYWFWKAGTLSVSTLPKSIALSHCGLDLSLGAGRRSVLPRFILLAQNGANFPLADELIQRKIKVFGSHYCSPSGIPPGEINFHFFSPCSSWQKLITGFIMPFSSPTLHLFWPPMSISFKLLQPSFPQFQSQHLHYALLPLKDSQELRFWSSQMVIWAFTKEWHCRWPAEERQTLPLPKRFRRHSG